ncbi:MAG TPA: hypothetical protein VMV47_10740 [Bacteroidales bacterium]|nr:hypothetical protein [Bacteroidales bacterium]
MKPIKLTILILALLTACSTPPQPEKPSQKLKRSDCFFGVHFDLHASEDITDAGKTLTEEMIDTFLLKVKPDFIQIDCKGHPGISSYPTKVGFHVKGFEKDPLKLFREVTAKNNVALFMHFSGVWDNKVVKEHPDWDIIRTDGKPSGQKVSFFSPYLDTYIIPQLKELSDYGVDGAWIDGECWAVEPDYGKESVNRFREETGITAIPKSPEDKNYPEFLEYTRGLFRKHLTKYIDAIHQYNPDFQITSNWAYSSIMPEKVTVNVDYLSGDVTPLNGVYRSAFESRCLAPQGKPWDLMAWGFSWDGGKMPMSVKSAVQLEQEAAQIMAMGGGVQFYFQQNKDLSIKPWLAGMLSEIGSFCRERQQFCHKAKPVPQVALLFPTASHQKNGTRSYSNSTWKLEGSLYMIMDGQFPVEILMEHHLRGNMDKYPLIVIPECNYLETAFLEELKNYVINGGNILVIGSETAELFKNELGILSIEMQEAKPEFIAAGRRIGGIRSPYARVTLAPDAKVISTYFRGSDFNQKGDVIASSSRKFGKGNITAVYFNAGSAYSEYKSHILRDYLSQHIESILTEPIVKVTGSHLVHVAVNKLNDITYVNLINVSGDHNTKSLIGYDEIPILKELIIEIKTRNQPAKIILQPEGKEITVDFHNGISKVVVPELNINSILEVVM